MSTLDEKLQVLFMKIVNAWSGKLRCDALPGPSIPPNWWDQAWYSLYPCAVYSCCTLCTSVHKTEHNKLSKQKGWNYIKYKILKNRILKKVLLEWYGALLSVSSITHHSHIMENQYCSVHWLHPLPCNGLMGILQRSVTRCWGREVVNNKYPECSVSALTSTPSQHFTDLWMKTAWTCCWANFNPLPNMCRLPVTGSSYKVSMYPMSVRFHPHRSAQLENLNSGQ